MLSTDRHTHTHTRDGRTHKVIAINPWRGLIKSKIRKGGMDFKGKNASRKTKIVFTALLPLGMTIVYSAQLNMYWAWGGGGII